MEESVLKLRRIKMEVVKEQLEGNKVALEVKIEKEKVDKALDQAYHKVVKDVNIPGFRKGKVPRKILERRYGKEVLHKDALDILIPEAYSEVIKEVELEPINKPEIEDYYLAENEEATFKAIVEVKPEVKLGEYTKSGIKIEEIEVSNEDIDSQLKSLQEQHAQLVESNKEELEEGDFAIIDFDGYIDGKPFPGGSAEEYSLEIGSDTFIPGFEEQLIAHKIDEDIEINVTFPENYHDEGMAGKDVVFKVKIKEVKVKEIPELNDDFAREVSQFDTLEELKEDIKNRLYKQKEEKARIKYENKLIEKISENAGVDIPEILVNNELDLMFQNLSLSVLQQGLKVEDYLSYLKMDEDSWRDNNRNAAEKRAKNNLVLEAIAKKEGIEISDEEIDNRFKEMSEGSEKTPEQIKTYFQVQGQYDFLVDSILIEKVIDFLKENN
jgi:trigger factor